MSVYYLGFYGYGASITNAKNRTSRLARFDGTEQIGMLLGTLLSPLVFSALGYLGCFVLKSAFYTIALVYVIFFVSEPIQKTERDTKPRRSVFRKVTGFLSEFLVLPFLAMVKTLIRPRPRHLRPLLWL